MVNLNKFQLIKMLERSLPRLRFLDQQQLVPIWHCQVTHLVPFYAANSAKTSTFCRAVLHLLIYTVIQCNDQFIEILNIIITIFCNRARFTSEAVDILATGQQEEYLPCSSMRSRAQKTDGSIKSHSTFPQSTP